MCYVSRPLAENTSASAAMRGRLTRKHGSAGKKSRKMALRAEGGVSALRFLTLAVKHV